MSNLNGDGRLRRQDEPPPRSGPRTEVVRLTGADKLYCTILSKGMWGVMVHWDKHRGKKGRTFPCIENDDTCKGCAVNMSKKWLGYLCIQAPGRGVCFVELTPECARLLNEQTAERATLRCAQAKFWRTNANNGRLKVEILHPDAKGENLPPEMDPEPILRWLWAWQQ